MIVSVCGLHGGAGTTTIAVLLAKAAASRNRSPVLLCDTDPSAGDLALALGVASELNLSQVAQAIDAGRRPTQPLWADVSDQLRLMARPPERARAARTQAIARVLTDAATAHPVVVIDAGRLTAKASLGALCVSDIVVWTLDATADLGRCATLLASVLADPARDARWVVAASATARHGDHTALRDLPAFLNAIDGHLLVPRLDQLPAEDPAVDLAQMQLLELLA
jgi:MinD-like ATPase involved in chromosome partitioning or flagellar assembly